MAPIRMARASNQGSFWLRMFVDLVLLTAEYMGSVTLTAKDPKP